MLHTTDTAATPTLLIRPRGRWALTEAAVLLEPLTAEHITAVATACADTAARTMLGHAFALGGPAPARRQAIADKFLGRWSAGYDAFAVVHDRRVVGLRYLESLYDGLYTCGGWIHPRWRRRGLGSAALRLAVAYAHEVHGATAVATGTRHDNLAAQANLASAGFRRGELKPRFVDDHLLQSWIHHRDDTAGKQLAVSGQRRRQPALRRR